MSEKKVNGVPLGRTPLGSASGGDTVSAVPWRGDVSLGGVARRLAERETPRLRFLEEVTVHVAPVDVGPRTSPVDAIKGAAAVDGATRMVVGLAVHAEGDASLVLDALRDVRGTFGVPERLVLDNLLAAPEIDAFAREHGIELWYVPMWKSKTYGGPGLSRVAGAPDASPVAHRLFQDAFAHREIRCERLILRDGVQVNGRRYSAGDLSILRNAGVRMVRVRVHLDTPDVALIEDPTTPGREIRALATLPRRHGT